LREHVTSIFRAEELAKKARNQRESRWQATCLPPPIHAGFLLAYSLALKMEACSSEMSVDF
jgi:hypothetical protein